MSHIKGGAATLRTLLAAVDERLAAVLLCSGDPLTGQRRLARLSSTLLAPKADLTFVGWRTAHAIDADEAIATRGAVRTVGPEFPTGVALVPAWPLAEKAIADLRTNGAAVGGAPEVVSPAPRTDARRISEGNTQTLIDARRVDTAFDPQDAATLAVAACNNTRSRGHGIAPGANFAAWLWFTGLRHAHLAESRDDGLFGETSENGAGADAVGAGMSSVALSASGAALARDPPGTRNARAARLPAAFAQKSTNAVVIVLARLARGSLPDDGAEAVTRKIAKGVRHTPVSEGIKAFGRSVVVEGVDAA